MSLGIISVATLTLPEVLAQYSLNPISAFMFIRWLGGTRHTEDLRTGISFPGYDSAGNPIDFEDLYQYADFVVTAAGELIPVAKDEPTREVQMEYPIYRLIIKSHREGFESGATYPGCTRENPGACKGISFATINDAFFYAHGHNEIPHVVETVEEVWTIAEAEERSRQLQQQYVGPGASPEPPLPVPTGGIFDQIGTPALVIGAIALLFLLKKG